jgi:asparagine synthase (glutamine-hydrolysing)
MGTGILIVLTTHYNKNLFEYSNHLGFVNPYYVRDREGKIKICSSFVEAMEYLSSEKELDILAATEVLAKNHMLGDRTLVQGINRSPWMAYPDTDQKEWVYHQLPQHGQQRLDKEAIAEELFRLLCIEIAGYVADKKRVGILLSGGMDSRIVAGVLDYLIKSGQICVDTVTAYTWGNHQTRDVVYAERIAERLGWRWQHFTVGPEELWENFKIAGYRGCEYSGIHLHAMPQVAQATQDEVMLAGSYGDSVGRAEYSGVHVENLQPITARMRNFGQLIDGKTYRTIEGTWEQDREPYHQLFPCHWNYAQLELERQLHYMRRMLNPCMEVINDRVPVFQAFTQPAVFGFMWSLSPDLRNDDIYHALLKNFPTDLSDIPWARTGKIYGETDGEADRFLKTHHTYSQAIHKNLYAKIEERIKNQKDWYFINQGAANSILKLIKCLPNHNFDYLERISWLVSFSFFLEKYQMTCSPTKTNFGSSAKTVMEYLAVYVYRIVKKKTE